MGAISRQDGAQVDDCLSEAAYLDWDMRFVRAGRGMWQLVSPEEHGLHVSFSKHSNKAATIEGSKASVTGPSPTMVFSSEGIQQRGTMLWRLRSSSKKFEVGVIPAKLEWEPNYLHLQGICGMKSQEVTGGGDGVTSV